MYTGRMLLAKRRGAQRVDRAAHGYSMGMARVWQGGANSCTAGRSYDVGMYAIEC